MYSQRVHTSIICDYILLGVPSPIQRTTSDNHQPRITRWHCSHWNLSKFGVCVRSSDYQVHGSTFCIASISHLDLSRSSRVGYLNAILYSHLGPPRTAAACACNHAQQRRPFSRHAFDTAALPPTFTHWLYRSETYTIYNPIWSIELLSYTPSGISRFYRYLTLLHTRVHRYEPRPTLPSDTPTPEAHVLPIAD